MYLVPPMSDEPPPEFVAFVTTHLAAVRRDAARLTGGDPDGTHLYLDALADVAGHWRRLVLLGRLRRALSPGHAPLDTPGDYLTRRLAELTRRWREDQVYEVDVRVLAEHPSRTYAHRPSGSIALRKATLLPDTVRVLAAPLADAAIAWVQAYRRAFRRRVVRTFLLTILSLVAAVEAMTWLSAGQ